MCVLHCIRGGLGNQQGKNKEWRSVIQTVPTGYKFHNIYCVYTMCSIYTWLLDYQYMVIALWLKITRWQWWDFFHKSFPFFNSSWWSFQTELMQRGLQLYRLISSFVRIKYCKFCVLEKVHKMFLHTLRWLRSGVTKRCLCADGPLDNNSICQVSLLQAQIPLRELPKRQRCGQDERWACCLGFLYKALDIADSATIRINYLKVP